MGDAAAELVARAKSGERSAFDELVRETYADTYALAFRLTGNEDDACDVLQDAYLRAYRSLKRFRGEAAFSTWMYRITANCATTHMVRRGRARHEEVVDALPQIMDGLETADRKVVRHIETCLRCQAELVQYRKLFRVLHQMRAQGAKPPPGTVGRILTGIEEAAERGAIRSALAGRR